MKLDYLYDIDDKETNLKEMVDAYEAESRQRSERRAKEKADNNEYMASLAVARLQYREAQKSTSCDEIVIDLSLGSFDQRMRWWTAIYYANLEAEMCNLYSKKGEYQIRPLPALLEVMKEPKKEGGFLFGVDFRKFYDRYVRS